MVDNYCERSDPGFWAEPVNALTNLAFVIAAILLVRLLHRTGINEGLVWVLAGLVLMIGIGSFLFHTLGTPWAAALDVLPILLFQLTYLWTYGRYILLFGRRLASASLLALVAGIVLSGQFTDLANGSLAYAPAWLVLVLLATVHWRRALAERWTLPLAALLFSLSLTLRTIDERACDLLPLGTHFGWHLLNGLVLYLAVRGLALNTSGAVEAKSRAEGR